MSLHVFRIICNNKTQNSSSYWVGGWQLETGLKSCQCQNVKEVCASLGIMWFMLDNEMWFQIENISNYIWKKSKHCVAKLPKCSIASAVFSDLICQSWHSTLETLMLMKWHFWMTNAWKSFNWFYSDCIFLNCWSLILGVLRIKRN